MKAFFALPLTLAACALPADFPPGEMERTFPRQLEEVWNATWEAAGELSLAVGSQTRDAQHGRMEAVSERGEPVTIEFRGSGTAGTSVRVVAGDGPLAKILLDRVSSKLGHATSAGSPSNALTR
jgi:hypothetical protein